MLLSWSSRRWVPKSASKCQRNSDHDLSTTPISLLWCLGYFVLESLPPSSLLTREATPYPQKVLGYKTATAGVAKVNAAAVQQEFLGQNTATAPQESLG